MKNIILFAMVNTVSMNYEVKIVYCLLFTVALAYCIVDMLLLKCDLKRPILKGIID